MTNFYLKGIGYANTEIEMDSAIKLSDILAQEFHDTEVYTKGDINILRQKIIIKADKLAYAKNNLIKLVESDEDFGWYEELNLSFSGSKTDGQNLFLEQEVLKLISGEGK